MAYDFQFNNFSNFRLKENEPSEAAPLQADQPSYQ